MLGPNNYKRLIVKASLEEAEKSMTEFSAERGVAAFKPSQA